MGSYLTPQPRRITTGEGPQPMNHVEQIEIAGLPVDACGQTRERVQADPAICVEPDPQVDGLFHGFFAVKLDAVIDRSLMKNWKRETDFLEQLKIVEGLMGLEVGASVQLRYIARPCLDNWLLGRLDVVVVFHSTSDSIDAAELAAMRLWENAQAYLKLVAGRYEFSVVSDTDDLHALRIPFAIADVAEVARREELVNLDGRHGLYLVCPFGQAVRDMSRLCKGLLLQPEPSMFCVTLSPTRLTAGERSYFDGPLVKRSLASHPGVVPISSPDQAVAGGSGSNGPTPAGPGLALQMIHVASRGRIRSSLLGIVGSELSYPAVSPVIDKDLIERSRSGGSCFERAVGSAVQKAVRALSYHQCDPWVASLAPEGLDRVRYLVDPIQGSVAFQLPIMGDEGEPIPGLTMKTSIPFVASQTPMSGTVIGISRYGTVRAEVRVGPDDRTRHAFVGGATGSGKSSLIINMATQDMCAGHAVIVLDFHGDLCQALLGRIPSSRLDDVVYLNPSDADYPIGLNLLAYDHASPHKEQQKERIIDCMTSYLKRQFPGEVMGPVFFQAFRNAFHLMMANEQRPAILLDLPLIFLDEEFARERVKAMPASLAKKYWEQAVRSRSMWKASSDGASMSQYVTSKFSGLVEMSLTRNIFGQAQSKLDFRKVLDEKKILLCNFSKGLVGAAFAELLSFITLFKIEEAALSRADLPESDRAGCSLYIDESQNLQTEQFPHMLSEMRKYGINITLATQHFSQLAVEMQESISANCGTLVIFRAGMKDAEALEPAFYPFDKRLIVSQPNFQAVVKTLVDGAVKLFTMETLPVSQPAWSVADPQRVIEVSRERYGTPRADVEREVMAALNWTQDRETGEPNGNR